MKQHDMRIKRGRCTTQQKLHQPTMFHVVCAGNWEQFSTSNNRASVRLHWLRYRHCAKLPSAPLPSSKSPLLTLLHPLSPRDTSRDMPHVPTCHKNLLLTTVAAFIRRLLAPPLRARTPRRHLPALSCLISISSISLLLCPHPTTTPSTTTITTTTTTLATSTTITPTSITMSTSIFVYTSSLPHCHTNNS